MVSSKWWVVSSKWLMGRCGVVWLRRCIRGRWWRW